MKFLQDGSEESTAYVGGSGGSSQHNVVSVPTTSNATNNGAALISAVGDIDDASESNHYVIQLDSAVYNLGGSALTMKPFVHIRGMNRVATTITSSNTMTIHGAEMATLSFLGLTNTASGSTVYHLGNGADSFLFNVLIIISGASGGDNKGVLVNGSNTQLGLDNVSIFGELDNSGSTLYGAYVNGSGCEIEIENSFMEVATLSNSGTAIGAQATSGNELSIVRSDFEVYDDSPNGTAVATGVKIDSSALGWIHFSLIESSGAALDNNGSTYQTNNTLISNSNPQD